jgi:hypothetical protein
VLCSQAMRRIKAERAMPRSPAMNMRLSFNG